MAEDGRMCRLCQEVLDGGETDLQKGFDAYRSRDYDTSYRLLTPLAQAGVPVALCLVGSMKHLGFGIQPDYKTAAAYYEQAGQSGCSLAFSNLATMYVTGQVEGQRNIPQAKKYLGDF